MSFLSRAVCRWGPGCFCWVLPGGFAAVDGASGGGLGGLSLMRMVGRFGASAGLGCSSSALTLSAFNESTRLEASEILLRNDSCESSCAVSFERLLLRSGSLVRRLADIRRSCFLLGPREYSSSLSGSRSTLELSCAEDWLPFSSAFSSLSTARLTSPLHSSSACLMVGLSARYGNDDETTSIIHGNTRGVFASFSFCFCSS